jgi:hypothetical protein
MKDLRDLHYTQSIRSQMEIENQSRQFRMLEKTVEN